MTRTLHRGGRRLGKTLTSFSCVPLMANYDDKVDIIWFIAHLPVTVVKSLPLRRSVDVVIRGILLRLSHEVCVRAQMASGEVVFGRVEE